MARRESMSEPQVALRHIWHVAGCEAGALGRVRLGGEESTLPGTFKVGTAAVASIAAGGLAAAELWRLRTGMGQTVSVETRTAATAFRSERYLRVDGRPAGELWSGISGFYRAGDGRWT